mgnify:CR=1 FL=1
MHLFAFNFDRERVQSGNVTVTDAFAEEGLIFEVTASAGTLEEETQSLLRSLTPKTSLGNLSAAVASTGAKGTSDHPPEHSRVRSSFATEECVIRFPPPRPFPLLFPLFYWWSFCHFCFNLGLVA